ncbi:MAG: RraA family protein [Solobacterium sp.]|nr:RraA family protein [Solobacterium sp.]
MDLTKEKINSLSKLPTGNVADNNPTGYVLTSQIQSVNPKLHMIGRAFPVICHPGDNLAIHEALHLAKENDVLIIDCDGYTEGGHFGDVMANACKEKGLAGVVINGTCRDAQDIRELQFPVYARGYCPAPTTKLHHAEYPEEMILGKAVIRKGDLVFGDGDGVVIIPKEKEDEVMENACKKYDKEQIILQDLHAGRELWVLMHFDKIKE